jgi:hypothetical protein
VSVEARYEGHTQHGEAWFRTDEAAHRIEWGSPERRVSRLARSQPGRRGIPPHALLETVRGDAPDSEVMGTLDAIRRLVEADE